MRIHFALALFVLLPSGLFGCSDKRTAEEKICREAIDRYIWCVGEILDEGMAAQASSKRNERIKACAQDEKIREKYQVCLPEKGCAAFMDCLIDYPRKTGSKSATGKTQKEPGSRELPP